ncbi:hypothetical protein PsorP6_001400 [Peronosclerospora sorghi]|uniref:Uncharacterized protein n=1 Tax=Peronosclerospora sorghi TaxID=230839 RepID=A0ACC0WYK5_9STRA|nr:hypothetical protein PsorP6_001400 [Peronosclerospora sorghi]
MGNCADRMLKTGVTCVGPSILHGNLHAMCHFQLIWDASWRHRCVQHTLNNCKLLVADLLVG